MSELTTAERLDLIDVDPAPPTPVEINTPRVRRQLSDLVHGQLAGSIPPEQIRDLIGAIYVQLNRASAAGAPPVADPIAVAEKAGNQLTAQDRIAQLYARCTGIVRDTPQRHLPIREVLEIIGKPEQWQVTR